MTDTELNTLLDRMASSYMRGDSLFKGGERLIYLALKHGGLTEERLDAGLKKFREDIQGGAEEWGKRLRERIRDK